MCHISRNMAYPAGHLWSTAERVRSMFLSYPGYKQENMIWKIATLTKWVCMNGAADDDTSHVLLIKRSHLGEAVQPLSPLAHSFSPSLSPPLSWPLSLSPFLSLMNRALHTGRQTIHKVSPRCYRCGAMLWPASCQEPIPHCYFSPPKRECFSLCFI